MPAISVIIPFYNCPYIQYALDSLLDQTDKDFEIIVIDDGSTTYTDLLDPYEKHIRYYRKENGGTATALNEGIRHAAGGYFTWLSSDDLYGREKLSRQKVFMENMQADISFTSADLIDHSSMLQKDLFQQRFTKYDDFLKELSRRCIIHGNSVMMKIEVFSDIGMFNEEFRYTHDYEMWLRAGLQYHFYHLNETLVHYRIHENMGSSKHKEEIILELKKLRKQYKEKYNCVLAQSRKRQNKKPF